MLVFMSILCMAAVCGRVVSYQPNAPGGKAFRKISRRVLLGPGTRRAIRVLPWRKIFAKGIRRPGIGLKGKVICTDPTMN
jgi:hypothetical protein